MTSTPRISLTAGSERRCPLRMPEAWAPPVPAFCGDLSALPRPIVVCLGVQSKRQTLPPEVESLRKWIDSHAPRIDQAWYMDAQGYRNDVLVAYWPDRRANANGRRASSPRGGPRPSASPATRGTGASASAPRQTIGRLCSRAMTGPPGSRRWARGCSVRWPSTATGEARAIASRLREARARWRPQTRPAQADDVRPVASRRATRTRLHHPFGAGLDRLHRSRSRALHTSASIRCWSAGMGYLRDHPCETGCYSCRFMQELEPDGSPTQRTFALAHFVSLAHLERWAASHPTHLAIFDEFLAMADRARTCDAPEALARGLRAAARGRAIRVPQLSPRYRAATVRALAEA